MIRSKKLFVLGAVMICMLIGCAFSFAAFSSQLDAKGNVSAYGNFDVYFADSQEGYYSANENLYNQNGISVKVAGYVEGSNHDAINLAIKVPHDFVGPVSFNLNVFNDGTVDAIASASTGEGGPFKLSANAVTVEPDDFEQLTVTLSKNGTLTPGSTSEITLDLVFIDPDIAVPSGPSHNAGHGA